MSRDVGLFCSLLYSQHPQRCHTYNIIKNNESFSGILYNTKCNFHVMLQMHGLMQVETEISQWAIFITLKTDNWGLERTMLCPRSHRWWVTQQGREPRLPDSQFQALYTGLHSSQWLCKLQLYGEAPGTFQLLYGVAWSSQIFTRLRLLIKPLGAPL